MNISTSGLRLHAARRRLPVHRHLAFRYQPTPLNLAKTICVNALVTGPLSVTTRKYVRPVASSPLTKMLEVVRLWRTTGVTPDNSVEELLHFLTVTFSDRVLAHDYEMKDVLMKKGERVALVLPSRDRDQQTFEDTTRVDFNRQRKPNLSFFGGVPQGRSSREDFGTALARHGAGKQAMDAASTATRYVQNLLREAPPPNYPFDGVTELWFTSSEAASQASSTPHSNRLLMSWQSSLIWTGRQRCCATSHIVGHASSRCKLAQHDEPDAADGSRS
jgi:hypothetical protein